MLTILFAAISLLREQLTAFAFGAGPAAEAFVIAYALPNFVIAMTAGMLGPVLQPLLLGLRYRENDDAVRRFTAAAFSANAIIGVVVATGLAVAAPWVLPLFASGFDSGRLVLAGELLRLLLPAVALSNIAYFWTALLNSQGRFVAGALGPSLQPLGGLLGIVAGGAGYGVHALAVGLSCGALAHTMFLAVAVRRAGFDLGAASPLASPHMRAFSANYATQFVGSALMGSTALVNQSLATMVAPGAVAHFNYATIIVLFVLGLGSRTIGQVILPHFSGLAAAAQWPELAGAARRILRLTWAVTVPATLGIIVLSTPLVRVVFEHGAFSESDTAAVSAVQRVLALQIPWYIANIVAVRVLSALQMNRAILVVAAANLALTAVISGLLVGPFGLTGLAFGATVVYAFSFVACWRWALAVVRQRALS